MALIFRRTENEGDARDGSCFGLFMLMRLTRFGMTVHTEFGRAWGLPGTCIPIHLAHLVDILILGSSSDILNPSVRLGSVGVR